VRVAGHAQHGKAHACHAAPCIFRFKTSRRRSRLSVSPRRRRIRASARREQRVASCRSG
jgi:hypothetical protein